MTALDRLLRDARVNAVFAWGMVLIIVGGAATSFVRVDPLWSGFAVVAAMTAAGPAVVRRDWTAMLRWEVVAVVALAVVVRAADLFVSPAGYVATAGLALVVAVQLDAFTPVEMTPRFGVLFVVVTTAAFAGVWGVVEFAADSVLGTAFLADTNELMWDLVLATAVGLLAGLCFDLYLRLAAPDRTGQRTSHESGARSDRTPLQASSLRYLVGAIQAALGVATLYAIVRANATLVVNTAVPFALASLPRAVRWWTDHDLGAGLALWIAMAAALHVAGALGLYAAFGWYDQVTHTVSASLVAGVGYAVVSALERHSTAIDFPPRFRLTLVVLFVLAIGVAWEILEFASGGLASLVGGEAALAQYGLADIALDLVFDGVGAVLVGVWGTSAFDGVANALARRLRLAGSD